MHTPMKPPTIKVMNFLSQISLCPFVILNLCLYSDPLCSDNRLPAFSHYDLYLLGFSRYGITQSTLF